MDLERVKHCLDTERRMLARHGEVIEVLPHLTRVCSTDGSRHMIEFSSLTASNADEIIAEQVAHYRTLGGEVEWKVYGHDEPADLLQRLARHGWEAGPSETVLVLDLIDRPSWVDAPPAHRVVRVESLEQVDLFKQVDEMIFQHDSASTANELRSGLLAGSTEHLGYIAYDGPIPAGVGRLYTHRSSVFGGLYGGGTLSDHRGRGLYRALVAARAHHAAESGARYLIVDALPTSRPILEGLGFVRLAETWPCRLPGSAVQPAAPDTIPP